MGLLRYLIIGAVLFLAGILLRRMLGALLRPPKSGSGSDEAGVATVRCAHCGLFIPRTQAFPAGDKNYCCESHRRSGSSE